MASFGAPLASLLGPVGVTGPSLGALWDSPPGRHYTASGRSFALARLPLGFPGPPLTPLWVSPGALWVRSRCYFLCFGETSRCRPCFCAIWGGARCAIRTCLCMFCKGSPSQKGLPFETLLRQPDGWYKRGGTQSGTRDARQLQKWCPRPL